MVSLFAEYPYDRNDNTYGKDKLGVFLPRLRHLLLGDVHFLHCDHGGYQSRKIQKRREPDFIFGKGGKLHHGDDVGFRTSDGDDCRVFRKSGNFQADNQRDYRQSDNVNGDNISRLYDYKGKKENKRIKIGSG